MDPIRPPEMPELIHLAEVLEGLGRNPALPDDLAVRLLPYGMAPLRLALRAGVAPSTALCEEFLARGEREALARSESLPPALAELLAADPDPDVRAVRARVEGAGTGRHAVFAADPDARVRAALANSGTELPEDVLRVLFTDADPQVRAAACKHRPPHDLHAALLADPATRRRVVRFARLDPDTAAALAADPGEEVRAQLAVHPDLPAELRDLLARDPSPHVRGKVFTRGDTPPELRDEIHAGLAAGARRADEDWEGAEEDDMYCEIVLISLDGEGYPWVAADPVPHAASPYPGLRRAAARSERLPTALLREMLSDEDQQIRMIALAGTPGVDLATAEDIERRHRRSKFGDRPADYFAFPPETLRRFATDPDARMRVLALRDPELPAALLDRLAADEDSTVRRALAEDSRTAPGTLLRLLGDGSQSVAVAAAASPQLPAAAMRALLDLAARAGAAERGQVVLLCGPSASGRDARARDLERRGYTRLSVDEDVRDRLGSDPAGLAPEAYDRLRADVERELRCELGQLLDDGEPVVLDHGFLDRSARERYQALFESHGRRWESVRVEHIEADPAPVGGRARQP
ncbi:AAA family ATPase [Streptomyces sp. NPDC091371]|uniref:AAA family ATPase n=1 Tax=Streptomyces sp. NPDC091371 TaxID=3155303 RepID=UPI003445ADB1